MNMTEKVVIGADVGGTKIKAGAVKADGTIIGNPVTIATGATDSRETVAGRIIRSIHEVTQQLAELNMHVDGIGLGVTGPLDVKSGKILVCPTLPTMNDYPLKAHVMEQFGKPVVMNNDANAMMLGETYWGAGRGYKNVLGITLGTGLGCALILNGKIWMGATETAGEIWTSPYKGGIIEDEVSGRGITAKYKRLTGVASEAKEIAVLARKGDQAAIQAWNDFGRDVAYALGWSVNLIDPEIIIIGGSISNALDLFYPAMSDAIEKYICPVPSQNLYIEKAILGNNAGFMGAAALFFSEYKF